MNDVFEMAAPAVFELLEIVRERLPGARWDPVTRPRPASAWADIYPAMWAAMANGKQPMTHDDYQEMMAYYRLAFLNMRQGSASSETWDCLALGVNLAIVLAEMGFGEEWLPVLKDAGAALERARTRGLQSGAKAYRMDGPGLGVMGEALDVLDGQLQIATRGEIVEARNTVLARIEQQKAEMEHAA